MMGHARTTRQTFVWLIIELVTASENAASQRVVGVE
jgi:hypothetical protein